MGEAQRLMRPCRVRRVKIERMKMIVDVDDV